jgi:hypothetical protein
VAGQCYGLTLGAKVGLLRLRESRWRITDGDLHENYARDLQQKTKRIITLVSHPLTWSQVLIGFAAPGLGPDSRDFWCAHTVKCGARL